MRWAKLSVWQHEGVSGCMARSTTGEGDLGKEVSAQFGTTCNMLLAVCYILWSSGPRCAESKRNHRRNVEVELRVSTAVEAQSSE